ncbi:MAG TPA: succinyl-diaminopimelate desuccinylase, partial [Microthrixaceae bacterium]|nr:succinyl-diaminopimelate desuccinylase [Microthrixaceae bacterium]
DMKGGLAVMLELARRHSAPALDVSYVFYAREEVAASESGLLELEAERPDLLVGDVAILGEPTDGSVEAGCQGVIRMNVTFAGARAHTARAWMGRNAIHRLGRLLVGLDAYESRQPVILGCRFHEALLATHVEGGVAGNVVPDRATVSIAHRFAPDRSMDEAEAHVRAVLEPFIEAGDTIEVIDRSPAAYPALEHPVVATLVTRHDLEVSAKLGWTDVARFSAWGVPAINLGPGMATLAHTKEERVERASLDRTFAVLDDLLANGASSV